MYSETQANTHTRTDCTRKLLLQSLNSGLSVDSDYSILIGKEERKRPETFVLLIFDQMFTILSLVVSPGKTLPADMQQCFQ